ncbi:hypothetical protein SDC9_85528 [bioreactor metagenome]|uniref:Uncharacterized protein n=1 Tax=bioreactor metagenome TaxID=1076179 RepID=A0A644ZDX9_9ZZZZ
MKLKRLLALVLACTLLTGLSACAEAPAPSAVTQPPSHSQGQLYLYGEAHGVEKIMNRELELWCQYYDKEQMRHLFIELPYFTAEFLNLWMQADNDDILTAVFEDWDGTAAYTPQTKEFYQNIKDRCPETIFYGTDVGHQYDTTGERFLAYLEGRGLKDSEQYLLAREAVEQGRYYFERQDPVYRENKMTENFVRAFDQLADAPVMGIYGSAHTGLDAMDFSTGSIPCMANQLRAIYGDAVHSEDLSWLTKDIAPERTEMITVGAADYTASYFGAQAVPWLEGYTYREFWRLEQAYDNFKDRPKTGDVLPYDNYPMLLDAGQVFIVDYTKTDGSRIRLFYRSDGSTWNGRPTTEEFTLP